MRTLRPGPYQRGDPTTRDAVFPRRDTMAFACCTLPAEVRAAAHARGFARAQPAEWV